MATHSKPAAKATSRRISNADAVADAAVGAAPTAAGDSYRIAAVSRLSRIPVPTIRMWERRYQVVEPARSAANGRLYSREDIARLTLLKAAVDAGHAIGTVAGLSDAQIRARLGETSATPFQANTGEPVPVLVCGDALGARLKQQWAGRRDLALIDIWPSLDALSEVVPPHAEAVIVSLPTLQASHVRALRQLRDEAQARVLLVVYGFSNRAALARLDQEGIIALPSTSDPSHLARLCILGHKQRSDARPRSLERELMHPAGPRRFSELYLQTVARENTAVRCECPHHLADLLSKLNAFEQYSAECENLDAADAAIHALLYAAASHCRELLENALERVLEHEGRPIPTAP